MKPVILVIICLLFFLSCRTNESRPVEHISSFLSEEIKTEFEKITEEFLEEYSNNQYPEFSILVTNNYVYIAVFSQLQDCPPLPPYYEFNEKLGKLYIGFTIRGNSHQPERFFKMDDFVLNKEIPNTFTLCHPPGFYYRYKIERNNRLNFEKRVKIIEGSPEEDLLVNEDQIFRMEIIEDPETLINEN